tara:strand:- start:638 stop:787 length:150 start_codon:yes stop_codon:yes gene_type:complete
LLSLAQVEVVRDEQVAAVQEVIVLLGTVRLVAVVVQAKLELLQLLLVTL